jgi:hypothetical protein
MYNQLLECLKELKELSGSSSNDSFHYQQAYTQLTKCILYYQQTEAYKKENIEVLLR